MEWRPIETAPKDGTAILLYGYTSGRRARQIAFGWWHQDEYDRLDVVRKEFDAAGNVTAEIKQLVKYGRGSWCCDMTGDEARFGLQDPTHWMPLPPKPTDE